MAKEVRWYGEVEPPHDGQAWEYKGRLRSVLEGDILKKTLSGWEGNEILARDSTKIWKSLGFSGAPSCPGAFFSRVTPSSGCPASVNTLLEWGVHGGWVEALRMKAVSGPLYHYDLKSAYHWASQYLYPEKTHYYEGEPNRTEWVGAVILWENRPDLPPWYRKAGKIVVISSEDVDYYGLKFQHCYGVDWEESTVDVGDAICRWYDVVPPRTYKLITQSFWGRWIASGRCVRLIYRDGKVVKEIPMKTVGRAGRNLVWAYLTVSRVIQRVWSAVDVDTAAVFVDSIITRNPDVELGNELGDWKLEAVHEKGLWIDSAGVYTALPVNNFDRSKWLRHSGHVAKAKPGALPFAKDMYSEGRRGGFLPDVGSA